ncbi:MAG: lysine 5,6-aminomutase subunit alpha TIM-barrel domain-containing protein, partial [Syntrophothermus sp.]
MDADPRAIAERAERLRALAVPLAGAWVGRARGSTSVGRERAILRLFGVAGLDRDGRPLAWAVVDRWLASGPGALGRGIALPFALALLEYDQPPQRIALDIAAGAIDLQMEAALLVESDRRAEAEIEAARLA